MSNNHVHAQQDAVGSSKLTDSKHAETAVPDSQQGLKTLMIAVYRPFSVRFILQTDIFKVLKNCKNIRIIIATHFPVTAELQRKYGGNNIFIEQMDMAALKASQRFRKIRFLMRRVRLLTYNMRSGHYLGHRRFAAYEFRKTQAKQKLRITGRLYTYAILLLPHLIGRARILRRGWVWLENWLYGEDTQSRLFSTYQPDMVLVTSLGYGYDEQIINEAHRRGTRVTSAIHSWDNTTTWGYPGGTPDYVIAWSDIMVQEACELLDIDKTRTFVGGIPHWDQYFNDAEPYMKREALLLHAGLSPERKTIYFPTASPTLYRHHITAIQGIADAIADGRLGEDVQLLVRPHPGYYDRQKSAWFSIIEEEMNRMSEIAKNSNGRIVVSGIQVSANSGSYDIHSNELERLKAILLHSDVMVNFYSTQAVEAALFDLPIVNIAFGQCKRTDLPARVMDNWDHFNRVLKTTGVASAYSVEEMINAINRYLVDPALDQEGRKRIVNQEIPVNRGTAGRMIGNHIIDLLNKVPQ